jgi:hypothetical protein
LDDQGNLVFVCEKCEPNMAPRESTLNNTNFDNVLEWFSGKSRETISAFTIPALIESAALGCWKKGVAVWVRSTLNKQNVAARWARAVENALKVDYKHPLHDGLVNMRFGSYDMAARMLSKEALNKLHAKSYFFTKRGTTQNVGEVIERWARANTEIAELVNLLNARRPKPVIVMAPLSPTVAANISTHIGIDVSTIQYPPSHGEWVELEYKGNKYRVYQVTIDWPEATQHGKSRFFQSANHLQCQACGHAIQKPFNWVPILAYGHGATPAPYALWVGRDCAEKLFGCKVEGDAIYPERQR